MSGDYAILSEIYQLNLRMSEIIRKFAPKICARVTCAHEYNYREAMKKSEFTQEEEQMIQEEFERLLEVYAKTRFGRKEELIRHAFAFAHKAHYGVRRLSGEPYIMHPLAVARICVSEIGLGSTSICSALLHDGRRH